MSEGFAESQRKSPGPQATVCRPTWYARIPKMAMCSMKDNCRGNSCQGAFCKPLDVVKCSRQMSHQPYQHWQHLGQVPGSRPCGARERIFDAADLQSFAAPAACLRCLATRRQVATLCFLFPQLTIRRLQGSAAMALRQLSRGAGRRLNPALAGITQRLFQTSSDAQLQQAHPQAVPMSKLKDSFLDGTSSTYLEELEERYRTDPKSVDKTWASFFRSLGQQIVRPSPFTMRSPCRCQ